MENLKNRSTHEGARQSTIAPLASLSGLRRFLRALWTVNSHGYRVTHRCLRCGHSVVDGMYCYHCGHVRPRQPAEERRRDRSAAAWLFKTR
jgi:hypothetical protein